MGMKEKIQPKRFFILKSVDGLSSHPVFRRALFYKGQAELDLKDYKQALVTLGKFIKESPIPTWRSLRGFSEPGRRRSWIPEEPAWNMDRSSRISLIRATPQALTSNGRRFCT